ncbi:MAG TPA: DinB family protein [Bacillales bacterium]|nr:DinB family protein [Bacillales bacterium]
MKEINVLRNLLLDELGVGVRTTVGLLQKVREEDWEYRPRENMRTLRELAHHLVMLPETDVAIAQEQSEQEVHQLESRELPNAEAMCDTMKQGYEKLKDHYISMSDEDFLEKGTSPFYLDNGSIQAKWLTETVTHTFHHRAQLFNYMKQLGYAINMFDLYE